MNITVKRYETKADAATIKLDGVTEDGKRQVRFSLPKLGAEKLVSGITNALAVKNLVFQLADGEWEVGLSPLRTKASADAPLVTKLWHDKPIFPVRPTKAGAGWAVDTQLPDKDGAAPASAETVEFLSQFAQEEDEIEG